VDCQTRLENGPLLVAISTILLQAENHIRVSACHDCDHSCRLTLFVAISTILLRADNHIRASACHDCDHSRCLFRRVSLLDMDDGILKLNHVSLIASIFFLIVLHFFPSCSYIIGFSLVDRIPFCYKTSIGVRMLEDVHYFLVYFGKF